MPPTQLKIDLPKVLGLNHPPCEVHQNIYIMGYNNFIILQQILIYAVYLVRKKCLLEFQRLFLSYHTFTNAANKQYPNPETSLLCGVLETINDKSLICWKLP